MNPLSLFTLLLLLVLNLTAMNSYSAKVYKWTDKDGNITYRDTPPHENSGTVEEKEIDPDQNVIEVSPPKPTTSSSSTGPRQSSSKAPSKKPLSIINQEGAGSTEDTHIKVPPTSHTQPPPGATPLPAVTPPPPPPPSPPPLQPTGGAL